MRARLRAMGRALAGVIIAALAVAVVGCAAPPAERAALDRASAAVERARSATRVRALAAAELDRAELTLERARAAAASGAPASHVGHLAYAAGRQAALAEAHAADRVAQAEIEALRQALDQQLAAIPADRAAPAGIGTSRLALDRQLAVAPADLGQERAAREPAPAVREAPLSDLTLRLADLEFEGGEPAGGAAGRLDEVAELLAALPVRKLAIEADFDRPDPVERTLMERRIETVRAALVRRGIDPSRIGVRTGPPPDWRAVWTLEHFAP
jgi:outer membrane protein OmpA-like peptidoglycan-associated protein